MAQHVVNLLLFVQVSEVYSLHRQTAYLAQDYFDRFMLTQQNVDKDYLQLIGISALFIASKIEVGLNFLSSVWGGVMGCFCKRVLAKLLLFFFFFLKEIYPPKMFEFAYVTDGACDVLDIQRTELHILTVCQLSFPPERILFV